MGEKLINLKMLRLAKRKNERDEEEEKKNEEALPSSGPKIQKKSPGELRLKKEIAELDLPSHA